MTCARLLRVDTWVGIITGPRRVDLNRAARMEVVKPRIDVHDCLATPTDMMSALPGHRQR